MPTMVHLEGTNFAVNMDKVDFIYKVDEDNNIDILFLLGEETQIWSFESADARDKVFNQLIHASSGRIYTSSGMSPRIEGYFKNTK